MNDIDFKITANIGLTVHKKDADFAIAILNKYLEDNGAYVKMEMCCTHYDDEVNHNYMKVRWAE